MRRLLGMLLLLSGLVFVPGCGTRPSPEAPSAAPPAAVLPADADVPDDRPAVVAFGDSLTAGLGVDVRQNYTAQLQAKIDAGGYRYRVVNAGVSGDTSAQGLNRLSAVTRLKPALVIVEFGANDGLRGIPVEETRRDLEEIIRQLVAGGSKIVLAGMEIPPNYGPQYIRQFHTIYPELAKQEGVSLVPFLLAGVGGIPELNFADGIHPTVQGYTIVTENIWKILQPLLKK
jgi:acyl-CoA thioesterase-1